MGKERKPEDKEKKSVWGEEEGENEGKKRLEWRGGKLKGLKTFNILQSGQIEFTNIDAMSPHWRSLKVWRSIMGSLI